MRDRLGSGVPADSAEPTIPLHCGGAVAVLCACVPEVAILGVFALSDLPGAFLQEHCRYRSNSNSYGWLIIAAPDGVDLVNSSCSLRCGGAAESLNPGAMTLI